MKKLIYFVLSYSFYSICYDNLIKPIHFTNKKRRKEGREEGGREGTKLTTKVGIIHIVMVLQAWRIQARVIVSQSLCQDARNKVNKNRNIWQGRTPCREALRGLSCNEDPMVLQMSGMCNICWKKKKPSRHQRWLKCQGQRSGAAQASGSSDVTITGAGCWKWSYKIWFALLEFSLA